MNLNELLAALAERGIRLEADGDTLRCIAPKGALSAELGAAIRAHKPALLAWLAATPAPDERGAAPFPAAPEQEFLPLSDAQERLWFWQQLHGANGIYNIPIAIPLGRERLQRVALQQALAWLVQRHQILRSVFSEQGGEPRLKILSLAEFCRRSRARAQHLGQWPAAAEAQWQSLSQQTKTDSAWAQRGLGLLSELQQPSAADDASLWLRQHLQDEAQRPFDLQQGPLFRVLALSTQSDPGQSSEHHSETSPDAGQTVLLLALHHIISDGWSNLVLIRELTSAYRSCCQGQVPQWPPLARQYHDYAYWQRQQLAALQPSASPTTQPASSQLAQQLAYWQQQLAGVPALLELPYDFPRPPVQAYAGASHYFQLGAELSQALRQLAREQGISLFMLLLATFMLLLARYSGRSDIVVGSPLSTRRQALLEEMIGPFINTVALRQQVDENLSIRDFLTRVRQRVLEAFDNQDAPFEQVVRALQLPRSLAHEPLAQINFLLKAPPPGELVQAAAEGLDQRFGFNMREVSGFAKSDLTVMTKEEGENIVGWFEYSTELFREARIAAMAGHYQRLLRSLVRQAQCAGTRGAGTQGAGLEQPLHHLNMLSVAEISQLRQWGGHDFSALRREQHAPPLPLSCWQQQCEAQPEALALAGFDAEGQWQEYSFAAVDTWSSALAARLQQLGAAPGQRVALALAPGLERARVILAVLKSGAAYVPLDPSQAPARLEELLLDTAPCLLLHDAGWGVEQAQATLHWPQYSLAELTAAELTVAELTVAELAATPAALSHAAWQPPELSADDSAYLIHTSGSSGRPKAVVLSQGNLAQFCAARAEYLDQRGIATRGLRWGWNVSYTFDMSWQGLVAWLMGASLIVVPEELRQDGRALNQFLQQHAVDLIDLTPSQTAAMLAVEECPAVPYLMLGGEAIDGQLWQALCAQPGLRVFNAYGPTEATVNTSIAELAAEDTPHIGAPLPGWQLQVVDDYGRLAAPGVAGELYIGGGGVAQAYWQRPELSAQAFPGDAWSEQSGARLYRSGDWVRWRDDGQLEYLGRRDGQLKLRGYRIEAGEVEAALKQQAEVADAAVCLVPAGAGDARLGALLVLNPTAQELDLSGLSHHLTQALAVRLPDYALPRQWHVVAQLPRSRHGKLLRRELAELFQGPAPVAEQGASTWAEHSVIGQLAGLWQELLGPQPLQPDSDFFTCGGHSLLLMRLLHRIEQRFQLRLSVKQLFDTPVLQEQAQLIELAQIQHQLQQQGDDGEREGMLI